MPVIQTTAPVFADIPTPATQTLPFGVTPNAGSAILVVVTGIVQDATTPWDVTDNYGNTYTLDKTSPAGTAYGAGYYGWAAVYRAGPGITTGGSFTVSVARHGGANGSIDAIAVEASLAATPFDKSNAATGTSTSPSAGTTGTLTTAPELVLAAVVVPAEGTNAITAPSGYTTLYNDSGSASVRPGGAAYKRVTVTTAENPTWTITSAQWFAAVATYKDSVNLPGTPSVSLAIGATDVVSVVSAASAGDYAVDHYLLYAGTAPQGETSTGVTATPGSYPLAFTGQARPSAGAAKYYYVKTVDANGNASVASVEVSDRITGIVNSGLTYNHVSGAGYGAGGAGLAGLSEIGYTVFDSIGAVLQAHTYASVIELPDWATNKSGVTGVYAVSVPLDYSWQGAIYWDAPPGGTAWVEFFDSRPLPLSTSGTIATAASATSFTGASGLSSSNDFYTGQYLVFTSGANAAEAQKVTAYVGSTRTFTTNAFANTPSAGDNFRIIGRSP